jgi:hypothetical protein
MRDKGWPMPTPREGCLRKDASVAKTSIAHVGRLFVGCWGVNGGGGGGGTAHVGRDGSVRVVQCSRLFGLCCQVWLELELELGLLWVWWTVLSRATGIKGMPATECGLAATHPSKQGW